MAELRRMGEERGKLVADSERVEERKGGRRKKGKEWRDSKETGEVGIIMEKRRDIVAANGCEEEWR